MTGTSGVDCQLYVGGQRIEDGTGFGAWPDPTGLSGLSITWGRSTVIDQPEPSYCQFDVVDDLGGHSFSELITVGAHMQVEATGMLYPPPSSSTFPNPGMETGPPNTIAASNVTVTRDTRRAYAGTYSAAMRINNPASGAGSTIYTPLPAVPVNTSPGAWDSIPKTAAGQTWRFGVDVFLPPNARAYLRAVEFSRPWGDPGYYNVVSAAIGSTPGTGAWQTLTATYAPTPDRWVGMWVQINPAGPTWDQAAGTWNGQPAGWTWDDHRTAYVDGLTVEAPPGGTPQTVLVFDGRITNLHLAHDDAVGAPVIRCTATDHTADLDNVDVGDTPWAVESVTARTSRILTAAGLPIAAQVDDSVGSTLVTWRDVDRQPATALIRELAVSVDGVLWAAAHITTGYYLWMEDPGQRPAPYVLTSVGVTGGVTIVPSATFEMELSACDVLRDPVEWVQDGGDFATRVAVTWKQQNVGPPISTTDQTFLLIDATREGYGPGKAGTRRIGIDTQLQSETDAATVAGRLLARTALAYRASGIILDDADLPDGDLSAATSRLLTLLDGTARIGVAAGLTDLPEWAPGQPTVTVFVEGGRYHYTKGRWVLELDVSNATGQGKSVTWNQTGAGPPSSAWTWNQFDPAISWDQLIGVSLRNA